MGAGDAAAAGHNANSERLTCGSWARADGGHACACGDGAIDARALATIGTLSVRTNTAHSVHGMHASTKHTQAQETQA